MKTILSILVLMSALTAQAQSQIQDVKKEDLVNLIVSKTAASCMQKINSQEGRLEFSEASQTEHGGVRTSVITFTLTQGDIITHSPMLFVKSELVDLGEVRGYQPTACGYDLN